MLKNSQFTKKSWYKLTAVVVFAVIVLGSAMSGSIHTNLLDSQPAAAQMSVITGDIPQQVYQQLPDLPKENSYTGKETGKVASNNTLVSRMIRYHIYLKGRAPNYRLDWKLTLADYLGANEIMYDTSYPGNDSLKKNPIDGDRAAISRLNRRQRNALVQALVNAFNKGNG
jgi:hypothetical protein